MNNYTIEAKHPAFGTVTFTIDATDANHSFSLWKQIVSSTKQWVVKRNEEGTACARPTHKVKEPIDDIRDIGDI
jgi:hypothetical protein